MVKYFFMKWITRERPKIDRIACPWLIKNFVDADAEFIYVPREKVIDEAYGDGHRQPNSNQAVKFINEAMV